MSRRLPARDPTGYLDALAEHFLGQTVRCLHSSVIVQSPGSPHEVRRCAVCGDVLHVPRPTFLYPVPGQTTGGGA